MSAEYDVLKPEPGMIDFVSAMFRHFNGKKIFSLCEGWLSGDLWLLAAMILSVTFIARLITNTWASLRGDHENMVSLLVQYVAIIVFLSLYKELMGLLAYGFQAIKEFFPLGDVKFLASKLDEMIAKGWEEVPFWRKISDDTIMYYIARGIYEVSSLLSVAFLLIFEIGHAMVYMLILVMGYILIPLAFVSKGFGQTTRNWGIALCIVMIWPVIDVVLIKMLSGMFFNLVNDPAIKIEGNGLAGVYFALMAFSIINVLICVVVAIAPILASKFITGNGDISAITRPFSLAALGVGAGAGYALHQAASHGRALLSRASTRAKANTAGNHLGDNASTKPHANRPYGSSFSSQGSVSPGSSSNAKHSDTSSQSAAFAAQGASSVPINTENSWIARSETGSMDHHRASYAPNASADPLNQSSATTATIHSSKPKSENEFSNAIDQPHTDVQPSAAVSVPSVTSPSVNAESLPKSESLTQKNRIQERTGKSPEIKETAPTVRSAGRPASSVKPGTSTAKPSALALEEKRTKDKRNAIIRHQLKNREKSDTAPTDKSSKTEQ